MFVTFNYKLNNVVIQYFTQTKPSRYQLISSCLPIDLYLYNYVMQDLFTKLYGFRLSYPGDFGGNVHRGTK